MLSTSGISLSKIDLEIKKIETENNIISEKVLDGSSLLKIASSASELGFNQTKAHVYISDSLPIAKK